MRLDDKVKFLSAIFLCAVTTTAKAQNLFANPGFEDINTCTEFKSPCAPEAWFNIPATNLVVTPKYAPRPMLGHMVLAVPVGNVMDNFNIPRYVYTALCCPLKPGEKYTLSFYLNTGRQVFAGLEFYFTHREPQLFNTETLTQAPGFILNNSHIDADMKEGWKHVQYEYTANGSEKFFIITTKHLPVQEFTMKDACNKSGDILYFIDEIKLQSTANIPLCSNYQENSKKVYDYDYRHTNNVPIFPDTPEVQHKPRFTNDTLVLPDLLFDIGKATIKANAKNLLDSLCTALQNKKFLVVNITGHTDSTGNADANQILSVARATAIQQYLLLKLPQFADKFKATGKGQSMPVVSNATAAGRQKNRRVEIVVTYFELQKQE
ncbi:MAG: OmpA family protein [Bacteroidetes bacterium]|nr:OmpA family protein [Bacteroidota bacterium]